MNKKRLLVLGAAAVMAFSLMGCGESKEQKLSEINPDKYVTLGDYKGLTVSFDSIEVTDDMIQAKIDSALEANAEEKEITDRAVQNGDIVNIDFAGSIDGVAFDGGTASGNELEIGSGKMIPGFEEGIVGMKSGEKKDIDVTFPEEYGSAELAGKDAVFAITVNSIKEKTIPELTDAVVPTLDESCKTVDEYKQKVKSDIEKTLKSSAESKAFDELFTKACENATVKNIPEWLQTIKESKIKESAEAYAKQYNMELADFLTSYMGQTEEQFNADSKTYATTGAEQSLVTYAIAKAEGLELSDEEIEDAVSTYAAQYGYTDNEKFKEESDMDAFEEFILKAKIQNMLFENANFVDSEGNPVDASYVSTASGNTAE